VRVERIEEGARDLRRGGLVRLWVRGWDRDVDLGGAWVEVREVTYDFASMLADRRLFRCCNRSGDLSVVE
jgi:hypothetical protein